MRFPWFRAVGATSFAVAVACGTSSKGDVETSVDGGSLVDGGGLAEAGDASPPNPSDAADAASCDYPPVDRGFVWNTGTSGSTSYYTYAPPAPVGVIVALHGTNGSSLAVAEKKVEWRAFFRDAALRKYALVVPESEQRTKPRQWDSDLSAANPDTSRITALLDELVVAGSISSTTPIYFVGISQGGGVAGIFGAVLATAGRRVGAVGVYCAGGSAAYSKPQYTIPTTFALMEKDSVTKDAAAVAANSSALNARGVDSILYTQREGRVCRARFARIAGVSVADSATIFDGLVAGGTLTAEGRVVTATTDNADSSVPPGLPPAYAPFADAVSEQLGVVASEHAFFGDRNAETLSFFDAHR